MACAPCKSRGGEPVKLAEDEVTRLRGQICPSWKLVDDGKAIERSFVCKNFMVGVGFINKLAELAEAEGHHPDFHLTSYRTVTVRLWTHSLGGLDMNDFILAAKSDRIPVDYSPKWLKENPDTTAGLPVAQV